MLCDAYISPRSFYPSFTVVRLCTETPTAGGRVLETGDEKLVQLVHDLQIQCGLSTPHLIDLCDQHDYQSVPVVIVFAQYDRLVRTKEAEDAEEDIDEATLKDQREEEARKAFEICVRSLKRTMNSLKIPMPCYAKVSGIFVPLYYLFWS